MNLNKLAKEITLKEGLKNQINIGDVKEIIKIIFTKLSLYQIISIWFKYNKREKA